VDGPLGMVLDEALLPDDLIKRQTHHSLFLARPVVTRLDRARYGSAPGTACQEYIATYRNAAR
jgi:hypothetical protein